MHLPAVKAGPYLVQRLATLAALLGLLLFGGFASPALALESPVIDCPAPLQVEGRLLRRESTNNGPVITVRDAAGERRFRVTPSTRIEDAEGTTTLEQVLVNSYVLVIGCPASNPEQFPTAEILQVLRDPSTATPSSTNTPTPFPTITGTPTDPVECPNPVNATGRYLGFEVTNAGSLITLRDSVSEKRILVTANTRFEDAEGTTTLEAIEENSYVTAFACAPIAGGLQYPVARLVRVIAPSPTFTSTPTATRTATPTPTLTEPTFTRTATPTFTTPTSTATPTATAGECQQEFRAEGRFLGWEITTSGLIFRIRENSVEKRFRASNNVEVEGIDGEAIPLQAIVPQSVVRVDACVVSNSTIPVARRVRVEELPSTSTPTPTPTATATRTVTPTATRTPQPTQDECDFRLFGYVEAVGDASIRVLGRTVLIDEDTRIENATTIIVGAWVEVRGCPTSNGSFRATRIVVRRSDEGVVIRLTGEILEFVGEAGIRIPAALIVTTENTEYESYTGADLTRADLAVGQVISVEGTRGANGTIVAREVKVRTTAPTPQPPSFEYFRLRGILQDKETTGVLVIEERAIRITENTRFVGANGAPSSIDALNVGDMLLVEGRRQGDVLTAGVVVKVPAVAVPVRLFGEVLDVSAEGTVFVAPKGGEVNPAVIYEVRTDERTRIVLRRGEEGSLDDVNAGDLVHVEAIRTNSTSTTQSLLLARVIRLVEREEPKPRCDDRREFAGPITAKDDAATSLTIGPRTVLVTAETELKDFLGREISFADLPVGRVAKVEGSPAANVDAIIACEIKLLQPDDALTPHRVIGPVASIDAAALTFVIRNLTIVTDAETEFRARRDDDTDFASLSVGDFVEVRGNPLGDGRFLARFVRVQEEHRPDPVTPFKAVGLITALLPEAPATPTSLVLNGRTTIGLGSNPVVLSFGPDQPIALSDLVVGDVIRVDGRPTSTTLEAKRIKVRASAIDAIDTDTLTISVAGVSVRITTETLILQGNDQRLEFGDLAVGDLVRVRAARTANPAVLRAIRIFRLGTPEFTEDRPITSPIGDDIRPALGEVVNGRPRLRSFENLGTFGFISLPTDSYEALPNTLYEMTAVVGSNVPNRRRVPALRLRTNNQSFEKASVTVIESERDGELSPGLAPREYKVFFVPAVPPSGATLTNDDWFASLDLLNFGGRDEANAEFELVSVNYTATALDRVLPVKTLVENTFDAGTEGWTFSAPPLLTAPISNVGENGTLDLSAVDAKTYGAWESRLDVTLEAGKIYRGRFFVRSASTDATKVPSFRCRFNSASFLLSSYIALESKAAGEEMPTADGRLYDVYFRVPAGVPTGDKLIVSFDLMNFEADNDLEKPISLDNFLLEEVAIPVE